MKGQESSRFHWVIVGASFVNLAFVYSIWYSFAVFFVNLLQEFGWSRSLGAGAFSLFGISGCLVAPLVGGLISTLGPQKVILGGSLFLASGLFLSSLVRNWWQFYLYFGIITAIGLGTTGWVAHVMVIQGWFKEKRGLAIGIISSGIGIGILFSSPSVQYLILRFGWRMTYRLMAIFIPLMVILITLAFLRKGPPSDSVQAPGAVPSSESFYVPPGKDEQGIVCSGTLQQALATKTFWFLGLCFSLANFITQSIFAHQVAFFIDQGIDPMFASYIVGIVGVVSLGSKILWGALSDRIGREMTYTLGVSCFVAGMFFLVLFRFVPVSNLLYFYSICFGMGYAVTAALPPLITADFFEGPAYGGVFGSIMVFVGVGGAAGAWFAGLVYDWTLSYVPTFVIMAVGALVSCLGVWSVGPRKVRMVPGKVGR